MGVSSFNWAVALPEIVLALAGVVILVAGVLQRKGEGFFSVAMLSVAALVLTGFLVLLAPAGAGYAATFLNDGFPRFSQLPLPVGGIAAVVLDLRCRTA